MIPEITSGDIRNNNFMEGTLSIYTYLHYAMITMNITIT
jgi:hypothetical protein